jgi:hypothetical protein
MRLRRQPKDREKKKNPFVSGVQPRISHARHGEPAHWLPVRVARRKWFSSRTPRRKTTLPAPNFRHNHHRQTWLKTVDLLAVSVSSEPFKIPHKLTETLILLPETRIGAGDGNRTHV